MIPWKRNAAEKILSGIAAVILWVFVMTEQNPVIEVSYRVPVHLVNMDTTQIVENKPETVKVTLRGPRNTILQMDQSVLEATINMKDVGIGEESLPISFQPPSGLSLVGEEPSVAKLYVDEYAIREVALGYETSGKLAKEHSLKGAKITPAKIALSGAKRRVDAVAKAYVPVRLEGQKADFTVQHDIVAVNAKNEVVQGIAITPVQGAVDVVVAHDTFEKTVPVVIHVKGRLAGQVALDMTTSPLTVTIRGGEEALANTMSILTEPVEMQDLQNGTVRQVKLVFPEGITSNIDSVAIEPAIGRM